MRRLELTDLEKKYKGRIAVQRTDLCLESGVYGLLGENRAGKTTLMRMICGILKPTSGAVLCDGLEIGQMGREYRGLLGYLPQSMGYYGDFSAWRFLRYLAALKAIPENRAESRMRELLELVDLYPYRKQKLKTYSGGMLRRIGIAQALLNDPDVLILDEPTSGLDPGERVRFRNLLSEFARDRIVLISTHIVSDIEYIAAENAIMKDGRLIDVGTTEQLLRAVEGKVFTALVPDGLLAQTEREVRVVSLKNEGGGQTLVRYVADAPLLRGSEFAEPRLEDLYLWLFKDERRQDDV